MDSWEAILRFIEAKKLYIPDDAEFRKYWEGTFDVTDDYIRARGRGHIQRVVGIYCCVCKKQYPPRDKNDEPYIDVCSCGHVMMDMVSMCGTCGVVTEWRDR